MYIVIYTRTPKAVTSPEFHLFVFFVFAKTALSQWWCVNSCICAWLLGALMFDGPCLFVHWSWVATWTFHWASFIQILSLFVFACLLLTERCCRLTLFCQSKYDRPLLYCIVTGLVLELGRASQFLDSIFFCVLRCFFLFQCLYFLLCLSACDFVFNFPTGHCKTPRLRVLKRAAWSTGLPDDSSIEQPMFIGLV
jgi:hypothetical protein